MTSGTLREHWTSNWRKQFPSSGLEKWMRGCSEIWRRYLSFYDQIFEETRQSDECWSLKSFYVKFHRIESPRSSEEGSCGVRIWTWCVFWGIMGLDVWKKARIWNELQLEPIATIWLCTIAWALLSGTDERILSPQMSELYLHWVPPACTILAADNHKKHPLLPSSSSTGRT